VSLLFALIQIIWLVGYVLLCVTRATSPFRINIFARNELTTCDDGGDSRQNKNIFFF
jgi:hypothetical protein